MKDKEKKKAYNVVVLLSKEYYHKYTIFIKVKNILINGIKTNTLKTCKLLYQGCLLVNEI